MKFKKSKSNYIKLGYEGLMDGIYIGGIIVYTLGHSFRYEMSVKRKLEIEYARLKRKVEKEGKK